MHDEALLSHAEEVRSKVEQAEALVQQVGQERSKGEALAEQLAASQVSAHDVTE